MKKYHEMELSTMAYIAMVTEQEMTKIPKGEILKAIQRMEDYPCCMSCYLTKEEVIAARDMRDNMIRILKEELGL